MKIYSLILALLLGGGLFVPMLAQSIEQLLQDYVGSHHTEKVYVNHDKPYYAPGESIWCKIYLLDGKTHQAFDAQPVIYADWIAPDSTLIKTFTLQIKDGSAQLDIATLPSDTTGAYTLSVYSQYQRNFADYFLFQKKIRLISARELSPTPTGEVTDFSIEFYPEGGHIVAGLQSAIAFKAQNELGKNIALEGVVLNEAGQKVADLRTFNEGMGLFKLIAKAVEKYRVRAKYKQAERVFELPEALTAGYVLSANSRSSDYIHLSLSSNTTDFLGHCTLIGHIRGQVFLNTALQDKEEQSLSLQKSELPSGLLHFTLFDTQQRPVCERLIFNKNPMEKVSIVLKSDKPFYGKREAVQINLALQLQGKITPANLSISVYNNDLVEQGLNNLNIQNYLWLQSDLKGRINNIQQYFEQDNAKTNTLLDLLLLTHGWRKFNWQDVLASKKPNLIYPTEEHLAIAGKITKLDRDKPVKADVLLSILSKDQFASLNMISGEDGLFYFKGFDFKDTTDILIQANIHNAKKKQKLKAGEVKRVGNKYVSIKILDLHQFPFSDIFSFPSKIYQVEKLKKYAYEVEQRQQLDTINNPLWSIDLEEVTVRSGLNRAQLRERQVKKTYRERGLFYFASTQKFLTDDPQYAAFQKNDIYDLIKVIVPRATIVKEGGRPKIYYGRLSLKIEPLLVLDGHVIPVNFLETIDPDNIAIIDVLEGLYASLYSRDRMVIALVSKVPGKVKKPNPGVINLRHPGYYTARSFYSPNYAVPEQAHQNPDYRTTLYWESELRIDQDTATIKFHTADQAGSYLIQIEGITESGIPFAQTERIAVRF